MALAPHFAQLSSVEQSRTTTRPVRRRGSAAAVAAIFALLALVFSPALASADAPMVLPNHITDTSGVLDSGQRSDIQAAIDQLGEDHQIDLWVAFRPRFQQPGWPGVGTADSHEVDAEYQVRPACSCHGGACLLPRCAR